MSEPQNGRGALFAGGLAAILASTCCLGPLVLVALGFSGAWIGNVHFPNGTRFRATYKGRTYHAQIKDDVWIGEDGIVRRSPSEAASAISDTNVNGWRFWFGIRPSEDEWKRLDEFRT